MNREIFESLGRLQKTALAVGLPCLALAGWGAARDPHLFFVSYAFVYFFWLGLSLGCLGVAMIHYLAGGLWGFTTRRFLEAAFMVLPLLMILFVPLLFGLHDLYPWSRPEEVLSDAILQKKQLYLNPAGFVGRAIFYFVVWILLAACLRTWSLQQDTTTDVAPTVRLRTLSGPGMVLYPLTATFAFVDWIMSMQPRWSSTVFPLIVIIGQVLAAFALVTLLLAWFRERPPFREMAVTKCFHDLGNLLLTFVMFWTYISFAQFLIVYSGNLPREIDWYRPRIQGGWKWFPGLLGLFHFFVPFFLLLFRKMKTHVPRLAVMAALILGAHLLALFWLVMPLFRPVNHCVHWLDFAVFLGMGGLWVAAFAWNLKQHALLPQNDPRLRDSLLQVAHAK